MSSHKINRRHFIPFSISTFDVSPIDSVQYATHLLLAFNGCASKLSYLCLSTTLGNVNDSPVAGDAPPPPPLPSIFCTRLFGARALAAADVAAAVADARPSIPPKSILSAFLLLKPLPLL